jgi:L-iditol 2-dehydrogenase
LKAAVYHSPEIKIEDIPLPEINEGDVLLKTRTCGVCGTDITKIRERKVPPGTVLGHEVSGDIVKIGKGVRNFRTGDRVCVLHHIPCFTCNFCRHGNFSSCRQFKETNIFPGGFSEYIRIPEVNVRFGMQKLGNLSYEEGSLVESSACSLRAFKRAGFKKGDSVVIVGMGPAGLIHLLMAKALAASKIIGCDINGYRLKIAQKFGADLVVKPVASASKKIKGITKGFGADIAFVSVGIPEAIESAIGFVRTAGTVLVFAECRRDAEITISPNIIYHETSIIGSYSSTPLEQRECIELIKSGKLPVKKLITHRLRLSDIREVVPLSIKGGSALKIIIAFDKV